MTIINTFDIVINFLKKYEYLADTVLSRDYTDFIYKHSLDETSGIYDANFINRKRLVAVMTTIRPDVISEDVVKVLFLAETERCRNDSFGGYDDVLETLTAMLWEYNEDGRYNREFKDAKNANFDCLCGYKINKNAYSYHVGVDFIKKMTDLDGIEYLFYYLGIESELCSYLDITELKYHNDINSLSRIRLINEQLGREDHNLRFYKLKLEKAFQENDAWEIASAFQSVIKILIDADKAEAYNYFKKAVPYLMQDKEWFKCNLGRYYIIIASELIKHIPDSRETLWPIWKEYIITANKHIFNESLREKLLESAVIMNDNDAVSRIKIFQMRKSPANLEITIDEIVDDSFYPGICKASFVDINGKKHIFTDKIPIFTTESNPDIPSKGLLRCEVVENKEDVVIINTEIPDCVEDQNGEYIFEVDISMVEFIG